MRFLNSTFDEVKLELLNGINKLHRRDREYKWYPRLEMSVFALLETVPSHGGLPRTEKLRIMIMRGLARGHEKQRTCEWPKAIHLLQASLILNQT